MKDYPMMAFQEALEAVLERVHPLPLVEMELEGAFGHILAQDIWAQEDLPPVPVSDRDGFAVRSGGATGRRKIVGEQLAGRPLTLEVAPETAVRITTGAPIPPGADAVVMAEDAREEDGWVTLLGEVRAGDNVRPRGQDLAAGSLVFAAGTLLGPPEVGLLASLGCARPSVYPRARVAIITTGDEVVEVAEPLAPGAVRDSNRYALMAAVRQAGGIPVPLGIARDREEDLWAKLRQGLDGADAVITSGGASVGKRDLVKPILERMGKVHVGRVAIKPGKPFTFATVEGKPIFGLPGFPVSSLVTFELLVRPALLKMMGHPRVLRPSRQAILEHGIRHSPQRTEFQRALVEEREGKLYGRTTGEQASSRLLSMVGANALLRLPQGREHFAEGEPVEAILIGEMSLWGS